MSLPCKISLNICHGMGAAPFGVTWVVAHAACPVLEMVWLQRDLYINDGSGLLAAKSSTFGEVYL